MNTTKTLTQLARDNSMSAIQMMNFYISMTVVTEDTICSDYYRMIVAKYDVLDCQTTRRTYDLALQERAKNHRMHYNKVGKNRLVRHA